MSSPGLNAIKLKLVIIKGKKCKQRISIDQYIFLNHKEYYIPAVGKLVFNLARVQIIVKIDVL